MGRPPLPLLALSLLLAALSLKELVTPVPYRTAPSPAPAGAGGELEDEADDGEDPFDFGDEDEGQEPAAGRDTKLEHWLKQVIENEHDAADAAFSFAGDGLETLGDLIDANLLEEDFTDMGLSSMAGRRLLNELDGAAGGSRKGRKRPDGGVSGGDGGGRQQGPPVSPMKAAVAGGLKYLFYAGMALMWFGEKIFGALGMAVPGWFTMMQGNRTQVMVGLMVLNQAGPMLLGA